MSLCGSAWFDWTDGSLVAAVLYVLRRGASGAVGRAFSLRRHQVLHWVAVCYPNPNLNPVLGDSGPLPCVVGAATADRVCWPFCDGEFHLRISTAVHALVRSVL